MNSFTYWVLNDLYAKQEKSRLSEISNMFDWNPLRPIFEEKYDNKARKAEGQTAMSL